MPGEQPQASLSTLPRSSRWVTTLIVSVGLLALIGFSLLKLSAGPSLRLKACFQDVSGLRRGARVRLAGVDIGTVRNVRAQPTEKTCSASVEMELRAPYELKIPKDSVVSIATDGILGEAYLEIDSSQASGPIIQDDGQLPSRESVKFTAETVDRAFKAVKELKQLLDEEKNQSPQPAEAQPNVKPSPRPSASSTPR